MPIDINYYEKQYDKLVSSVQELKFLIGEMNVFIKIYQSKMEQEEKNSDKYLSAIKDKESMISFAEQVDNITRECSSSISSMREAIDKYKFDLISNDALIYKQILDSCSDNADMAHYTQKKCQNIIGVK